MSVLLSDLLVPGWAEGDNAMKGISDISNADYNLPCHTAEPDTFFAEDDLTIEYAKSLCGGCPLQSACLAGALSRSEPCGVWGGELFQDGRPIAQKRRVGRPRLLRVEQSQAAPLRTSTLTLNRPESTYDLARIVEIDGDSSFEQVARAG